MLLLKRVACRSASASTESTCRGMASSVRAFRVGYVLLQFVFGAEAAQFTGKRLMKRPEQGRQRKSKSTPFGSALIAFSAVASQSWSVVHADAGPASQASSLSEAALLKDLNVGTWIRDDAASELAAYERMLELMQLSGLQRTTALKLIEGLELSESEAGLSIRFLTVVPFFKVTEEVAFGSETRQPRRDLRAGKQVARAARIAGGVYVEMSWGEPLAGRLCETYYVDGAKLLVRSQVTIDGRSEETTVVYRRSRDWRPRFQFPGT